MASHLPAARPGPLLSVERAALVNGVVDSSLVLIEYFRLESVTVARYIYRGNKIPSPWPTRTTA
jgi:hypothetical protein